MSKKEHSLQFAHGYLTSNSQSFGGMKAYHEDLAVQGSQHTSIQVDGSQVITHASFCLPVPNLTTPIVSTFHNPGTSYSFQTVLGDFHGSNLFREYEPIELDTEYTATGNGFVVGSAHVSKTGSWGAIVGQQQLSGGAMTDVVGCSVDLLYPGAKLYHGCFCMPVQKGVKYKVATAQGEERSGEMSTTLFFVPTGGGIKAKMLPMEPIAQGQEVVKETDGFLTVMLKIKNNLQQAKALIYSASGSGPLSDHLVAGVCVQRNTWNMKCPISSAGVPIKKGQRFKIDPVDLHGQAEVVAYWTPIVI
ncbi:MAG: hypothetical protein AAFQ98_02810 [Bacteroidota bacterium]